MFRGKGEAGLGGAGVGSGKEFCWGVVECCWCFVKQQRVVCDFRVQIFGAAWGPNWG